MKTLARWLLVLAVMLGAPSPATAQGDRRPNIIVILADDLGWGDLGVQGGRDVSTPNIDALAAQGVRMTDFYANHPSCAPSRAALLSGRYQHRFGFENNPGAAQQTSPEVALPRDAGTLPERLRGLGYATAMIGKWHIGFTPENLPTGRGFERFYGFLDGAMAYTPQGRTGSKAMIRGVSPAPMPAHTTEAFADEAVRFIRDQRERPFFLYVAFNAVHAPLQTTDAYLARVAHIADPQRRTYLAMLAAMDDAVGQIAAAADANGRETLIVFTSDNGGPTWQTTSSNGPLNGVKALVLEGGIRVPTVLRWRGRLPQGAVSSTVATGFDITATALAAAGAPRTRDLDGMDLTPILTGARKAPAARPLYWRLGPQGAMRAGDWKLIKAEDSWMLFNLARDPGERTNLAAVEPERLAQMAADWRRWSGTMPEPKWGSLNRTGRASRGEVRALIEDFVQGRPTDPRSLLYGGGPE